MRLEAALWKSDGSQAGTTLVKDIRPGAFDSYLDDLVNANGLLLFSATDGVNGTELWRSDGTDAGTVMVKDIYPGVSGSSPSEMTYVNGTVYFSAYHPSAGRELWKTDGTTAGTLPVEDILPGVYSSNPDDLTEANGILYFTAHDGSSGRELWRSLGAAANTIQVADICPGACGSNPMALTAVIGQPNRSPGATLGNYLFFAASDGSHGLELWAFHYPGVASPIGDIASGGLSSSPESLTWAGDLLFFSADDNSSASNRELWALSLVADLSIAQSVSPEIVAPGQTLTLSLTLSNNGLGLAGGVVITDALPVELTNVSVASSLLITDTGATPPYVWEVADLDIWESGVITITATVSPGVTSEYTVTNQAALAMQSGEINLANNSSQSVFEINLAPTVDAGPDQIVSESQSVDFAGSFDDPGLDDTHTIGWDFGDGETASGVLTPTHSYPDEGVFTVTLTIAGDDGGVGVDALTVTVENAAPTVDAGPDQIVNESQWVSFSGSFDDPGPDDTHTIGWDFDDGQGFLRLLGR